MVIGSNSIIMFDLGMARHYKSILMPDVSCRWVILSNLPGVHTLAAMGLLWALEKDYYATHHV
jgi:hypothetical protein